MSNVAHSESSAGLIDAYNVQLHFCAAEAHHNY